MQYFYHFTYYKNTLFKTFGSIISILKFFEKSKLFYMAIFYHQ